MITTESPPAEGHAAATVADRTQKVAARPLKTLRNGVIAALGLIAVISMFLMSYSGAFGNPKPHDIPVAVVAPGNVTEQLDTSSSLDARPVESAAEARELVEDRTVYGAFVVGQEGDVRLDVASGGGRAVAAALSGIGESFAEESNAKLTVHELAPLSDKNPSGALEFYCVVFMGVAAAAGSTVLGRVLGTVRSLRHMMGRGAFLLGYTALLSATFLLITNGVDGALTGSPGPLFLAFWGYSTAVCLAVTGIAARFGTVAGLIATVTLTILGNASAGGPSPRPMLNSFFQAIQPVFPQGAGLDWIRGAQYFDGQGIGAGTITLAIWGGLGLLFLAGASYREGHRRTGTAPAAVASAAG